AQCIFDADIAVNSCGFNSSTQLTANLTISPTAVTGWHAATVTNPSGQNGSLTDAVYVQAPPQVKQSATFSVQSDTSGTATVTLPKSVRLEDTLIVGISFWPADIAGVTLSRSGSSIGTRLTRGLPTSIYHNVSGRPFYTNFYYLVSGDDTLPGTLTLNFSGGPTYAQIAVAEVSVNADPATQLFHFQSVF